MMTNLGRAAKVVALLLFLLPWITVSCSPSAMSSMAGAAGAPPMAQMPGGTGDLTLVTATGVQLAMGSATMNNPAMPGAPAAAPTPSTNPNSPFAKPNMAVLAGAVLILLALAGTFLLQGKTGALVGAGGSALAAAAICYAVLVQIPAEVRASFAASPPGGPGGPQISAAEMAQLIQVKAQMGFWLTVGALALAVVLNVLGMGRSSASAAAPAAAPPPAPAA